MSTIKTEQIFNVLSKGVKECCAILEKSDEQEPLIAQNKDRFKDFEAKLQRSIKELEDNAEYECLQIAFYGETNAGKSTIIETLRIHFNEPSKEHNMQQFKAIINTFNVLDKELQESIKDITKKIEQVEGDILQCELVYKKEIQSFFGKIKDLFGFGTKRIIRLHQKNQKKLETQLQKTIKEQEDNRAQLKLDVAAYCDGNNISSQTDFTKETIAYNCHFKDKTFSLLDVPGIEGKEESLKSEIKKATQKAHCIFCIVRDKIESGTLKMIQEALNDQTEVWLIFNDSATMPQAMVQKNDSKQIAAMEAKMQEALHNTFKGTKRIFALPALYAKAQCLMPDSFEPLGNKKQEKFLHYYKNKEQLFEASKLKDFVEFIEDNIINGAEEKIRKNIFNKANKLLESFAKKLDIFCNEFQQLCERIKKDEAYLAQGLDNVSSSYHKKFDSIIARKSETFISTFREEIYKKEIEKDISDKEFESIVKERLEVQSPRLQEEINEALSQGAEDMQKALQDEFKNFERHNLEAAYEFEEFILQQTELRFEERDNGISYAGLASTRLSIAGIVTAIIFGVSGPWGWVALAAGVITAILSGYKAVIKRFSSSYKKSEQRKSLDQVLI